MRRTRQTGSGQLTGKHQASRNSAFANEQHVEAETTRGPDRTASQTAFTDLTDRLSTAAMALKDLQKLSGTLQQRTADILARVDRPHASREPTEAISGRLQNLNSSTLGFSNLTPYVSRSLLHSGGFRTRLHPQF